MGRILSQRAYEISRVSIYRVLGAERIWRDPLRYNMDMIKSKRSKRPNVSSIMFPSFHEGDYLVLFVCLCWVGLLNGSLIANIVSGSGLFYVALSMIWLVLLAISLVSTKRLPDYNERFYVALSYYALLTLLTIGSLISYHWRVNNVIEIINTLLLIVFALRGLVFIVLALKIYINIEARSKQERYKSMLGSRLSGYQVGPRLAFFIIVVAGGVSLVVWSRQVSVMLQCSLSIVYTYLVVRIALFSRERPYL